MLPKAGNCEGSETVGEDGQVHVGEMSTMGDPDTGPSEPLFM